MSSVGKYVKNMICVCFDQENCLGDCLSRVVTPVLLEYKCDHSGSKGAHFCVVANEFRTVGKCQAGNVYILSPL